MTFLFLTRVRVGLTVYSSPWLTLTKAVPAQGHYTEGAELIDSVLDVVRKEATGLVAGSSSIWFRGLPQ